MGKDRLEDHIKNKIYPHQSPIDTNELWSAISAKKKKRRWPLWILLSGLGLMVLSLVLFNALGNTEIKNENLSDNLAYHKEDTEANSNLNHKEPIEEKANAIKKSIENTKSTVSTTKTKNQDLEKQILISVYKKDDGTNSVEEKLSITSEAPLEITNNNTNTDWKEEEAFSSTNYNQNFAQLDALARLPNNVSVMSWKRLVELDLHPSIIMDKPIVSISKGSFYTSIRGNYLKGNRLLCTTDTSFVLAQRKSNETFMESWGIAAVFGYQFANGIYLDAGLAYQQINDRSIWRTIEEEKVYDNLAAFAIYAKSSQLFDQHRYNKIRMMDIPINMGYTLTFGKIELGLGAGININISTAARGAIIGIDGVVDVEEASIFKSRIGYSYDADLQLGYLFTEGCKFSLTPMYRFYPSSFTTESYGIDQKYRKWGVEAGLTHRF